MALMVLDVVEFEIARPKAFAQPLRMSEHAKITIAYLRDAAVGPCPEHRRRNQGSLCRLHYLVPEYPRLPIVPDMFDVFKRDSGVIQAKFYRMVWKTAMVFFPRKPLFLHRRDQFSIFDQCRSRVTQSCKP